MVARPSKWGNPFGRDSLMAGGPDAIADARHTAAAQHREWLGQPDQAELRAAIGNELAGKDLACWCPLGQSCHADVLLEIANGGSS